MIYVPDRAKDESKIIYLCQGPDSVRTRLWATCAAGYSERLVAAGLRSPACRVRRVAVGRPCGHAPGRVGLDRPRRRARSVLVVGPHAFLPLGVRTGGSLGVA